MGLSSLDLTQWMRPAGRFIEVRSPRMFTWVRRVVFDLRLLLGGKLLLFLALDALIVVSALFDVLSQGGGVNLVYFRVVVVPTLLLGVPALSSIVALERRAGSLDLALAVPSTVRFFLRRASSVVAVLSLQAFALMVLAWIETAQSLTQALTSDLGALLRALAQTTTMLLLLPAVVLFWSVRARSAGAVMVGSAATFAALLPWASRAPDPPRGIETLLGIPLWILSWSLDLSILIVAVVAFGLYAREGLRRPERLLM